MSLSAWSSMLYSNVEFTDSNHGIHYLNPKYIFGMIPPQKSEIFKCSNHFVQLCCLHRGDFEGNTPWQKEYLRQDRQRIIGPQHSWLLKALQENPKCIIIKEIHQLWTTVFWSAKKDRHSRKYRANFSCLLGLGLTTSKLMLGTWHAARPYKDRWAESTQKLVPTTL